jgi:hypothetical protein
MTGETVGNNLVDDKPKETITTFFNSASVCVVQGRALVFRINTYRHAFSLKG